MLSKEQIDKYLKCHALKCLYCEATGIEVLKTESYDDSCLKEEVKCNECKKKWLDVYSITSVEEIE